MRLLIIDDNQALAEVTADLLHCMDQPVQQIGEITLATNLEAALKVLPEHDIVLCDGEFPASADAPSSSEEWVSVFRESCRSGVTFILYSGSAVCLEDAHCCSIPAIAKPAAVEDIYAALTDLGNQTNRLQPLYQAVSERILQRGGQA
jgi:CheY-like chemotaxis protein